jgi:hypothetical protein
MFIPHPSNLWPLNRSPRGGGPMALSYAVMGFGAFGIFVLAPLIGGTEFHWWGGVLGFFVGMFVVQLPPVVLGLVECAVYGGLTFVFSDGLENPSATEPYLYAAIAVLVFAAATYGQWKATRRG